MYASFGKSCEVIWGSPKDTNNLPMVRFDVVYDNNGKVCTSSFPTLLSVAQPARMMPLVPGGDVIVTGERGCCTF